MGLSLKYILKKIENLNIDYKYSFDVSLNKIRMLDTKDLNLEDDILYITNVSDFSKINNRISKKNIIISDHMSLMEKIEISSDLNFVIVKDRISLEELTNKMIKIFEDYSNIINEIKDNVYNNFDITKSLNLINDIFNINIYILKDDFSMMASSHNNNILISEKEVEFIKEDNKLHNFSKHLTRKYNDNKEIYYITQIIENRLMYIFIDFSKNDNVINEILQMAYLLKPSLKNVLYSDKDSHSKIKQIILKLLKEEDERGILLNKLKETNWEYNHKYKIFLYNISDFDVNKSIGDIENIHKESVVIELGNQYLLVINESLSNINWKKLDKFVLNNNIISVFSNSFYNIDEIRDYYLSNLLLLNKCGVQGKYVNFKDDHTSFVSELIYGKIPIKPLISKYILLIEKQDVDENSDNLETLYLYLKHERSYLKTSKIMNLHRNSIVYRISRIQETYNLDLDNEEIRSYLIFSYELLKMIKKKKIKI